MSNENLQENAPKKLPTPEELRVKLDEYVIGQDDAKRVLSVAVYNHYKRINYTMSGAAQAGGLEIKKSNVLMIGPTGSGKTLIASTVARILDVPFTMADATALVAGSNIGKDIENILISLIQNAGDDIARAEQGIVYIDEIDKIAKREYNRGVGEGIQQQLLKIIEGTVSNVRLDSKEIKISTDNILFIVGGAFVGLDTLVQSRIGGTEAALMDVSELIRQATPEDIAKFGLIPEFIGRVPVIVGLAALDREALIDALTKPKNALVEQYKKMFAIDGVELAFDQSGLEMVAELAMDLRTGARGLRTIMEDRMLDIMYTVPSEKNLRKITITKDVITKTGKPIFEYFQSDEEVELEPLPPKFVREKSAYAD